MVPPMATLELSVTIFAPQRFSNNYHRFTVKTPDSVKLNASTSLPSSSLSHNHNKPLFSSKTPRLCIVLRSALQDAASVAAEEENREDEKPEQTQTIDNVRKKLFVVNLPWSVSAPDIKVLFEQCGTVADVEIIKNKDGKGRGYAFVTMGSGEEAQAAVDKFDAHEISGRIIRVEFAKGLKKPPPPATPSPPLRETRHVIYASNLAWKARATHLRDLFTENFKDPVSARVVFESPGGRSAGYGFISYPTKEEAEAAISALDGKELMGRPLRLKFSERKVKEAGSEKGEEDQGSEKGEDQGSEKDEESAQPEES